MTRALRALRGRGVRLPFWSEQYRLAHRPGRASRRWQGFGTAGSGSEQKRRLNTKVQIMCWLTPWSVPSASSCRGPGAAGSPGGRRSRAACAGSWLCPGWVSRCHHPASCPRTAHTAEGLPECMSVAVCFLLNTLLLVFYACRARAVHEAGRCSLPMPRGSPGMSEQEHVSQPHLFGAAFTLMTLK